MATWTVGRVWYSSGVDLTQSTLTASSRTMAELISLGRGCMKPPNRVPPPYIHQRERDRATSTSIDHSHIRPLLPGFSHFRNDGHAAHTNGATRITAAGCSGPEHHRPTGPDRRGGRLPHAPVGRVYPLALRPIGQPALLTLRPRHSHVRNRPRRRLAQHQCI
ncbi:hypothetical protein LZ31DRAFT_123513 [Colletotrichum somersetense]|nr:hypothetical protein LZ31DRAFT_123513 [Colletotrichum somersetense]